MCILHVFVVFFFFSSRRRHTRLQGDWSSDVCSSDLSIGRNEASTGVSLQRLFMAMNPAGSFATVEQGLKISAALPSKRAASDEGLIVDLLQAICRNKTHAIAEAQN